MILFILLGENIINGENVNNINMDIEIQEKKRISIYKILKRAIDILSAIVGIIILCPLILIVFIVNKIDGDEGPIFFMQKRIGENRKIVYAI